MTDETTEAPPPDVRPPLERRRPTRAKSRDDVIAADRRRVGDGISPFTAEYEAWLGRQP